MGISMRTSHFHGGLLACALTILMVFGQACRHVHSDDASGPESGAASATSAKEEKLRAEARAAARERLEDVESLLEADRLDEAYSKLTPLRASPFFSDRVSELAERIERRLQAEANLLSYEETARRAMQGVRRRMRFPTDYGDTVVIERELTPIDVPPGPMEELVNKKVSMHLTDANVASIIMTLSKIDGLNIVADKALTQPPEGEDAPTLTVQVEDVPLKEILSYIARNMGIAFHISENVIWVTASRQPPGTGPELETRIHRLRRGFVPLLKGGGGGDPGAAAFGGDGGGGGGGGEEDLELFDALDALLGDGPEGSMFRIFRKRNLLVVRNTRENHRLVAELLKDFDKEPLQVLIESRFLTISQDDLLELGVDIEKLDLQPKDPDVEAEIMSLVSSSTFPDFAEGASGLNMTVSGILGNHEYRAILHLLEREGRARTLSAPRVSVLNNETARIRKGDVRYYFEEYDLESSGGDNPATRLVPSGSPQELELGITLAVKVNVGNDGEKIMLALKPEIKDFIKWEEFETVGNGGGDDDDTGDDDTAVEDNMGLVRLPHVNENMVETSVVVNSGETVVLGGMVSNSQQDTVRKVPILGDLPFVGFLFRHTTVSNIPQHLVIFVTASVLNPGGGFAEIQTQ